MKHGILFIISAPSGTGKTTILKRTLAILENVTFSVSHTTREPRTGEQEGIAYYFTDKVAFTAMRQEGVFLEWAEVHGNLYGTSSRSILAAMENGLDIILDIDVQGAQQVKKKMEGNNVSIFIAPPSIVELERRLAGRFSETEASIATRLKNAKEEIKCIGWYDYVIVNDSIDQAVEILKSIIIAERSRKRRGISGKPLNLIF